MSRIGRTGLVRIGIGVGCLVVLGIIYQHQRHPQPTSSRAVATVKDELARRGVAVDQVNCESSHLDPATLPAAAQVAALHQDQAALLYDCRAELAGTPPKGEPGFDMSWCVLGFSGSAPWIAYATPNECAAMVHVT
jgi:hypothetical protein